MTGRTNEAYAWLCTAPASIGGQVVGDLRHEPSGAERKGSERFWRVLNGTNRAGSEWTPDLVSSAAESLEVAKWDELNGPPTTPTIEPTGDAFSFFFFL